MATFRMLLLLAFGAFLGAAQPPAAFAATVEQGFEKIQTPVDQPDAPVFWAFLEILELIDSTEDGPENDDAPDDFHFSEAAKSPFFGASIFSSRLVFQKFHRSIFLEAAAARPALFDLFCCWKGWLA